MPTTQPRPTRIAGALACASAGLLLGGCGGAGTPADEVPELGDRLAQVDDALVERRFVQARRQLRQLERTAVSARRSGDLDAAQAEPILVAAADLRAALPRRAPAEPPPADEAPAPQPEDDADAPSPQPPPDEGLTEEEREKRQKEAEKRREEAQKRREEAQKRREEEAQQEQGEGDGDEEGGDEGGGDEGQGKGDSGSNGPDDGGGD
jgi:outer membrane biosynthesis protein TonB